MWSTASDLNMWSRRRKAKTWNKKRRRTHDHHCSVADLMHQLVRHRLLHHHDQQATQTWLKSKTLPSILTDLTST